MPQTGADLQRHLSRIDGKGYPAYKDIRGSYAFDDFTLFIDHVQGDPFAAPSRVRVRLPMPAAGFPADSRANRSRMIALRDFLARVFSGQCRALSNRSRGSGKSGLIAMDPPGQEILERSATIVTAEFVEARLMVGLPAQGRRVLGRQAAAMLCNDLPQIANAALKYARLDQKRLAAHLDAAEDADTLRAKLPELGLVAFVADGSILPRRSGVDDRPLRSDNVIPFRSPSSLRVEVTLPHAGKITGMGIPAGVTLIVGGGYHGKSTLLLALEKGVYNHIPGDGRELVVTNPTAVKIRAEDGRGVEGVDIRPFVNNLPDHGHAAAFRTDNASGSTSQAANIIEALEVGAKLLLLDEDTCATNLMIRDARMQALVEKSGEPITPFIDRVRQLAAPAQSPAEDERTRGVSSILVLGGSGDYFDVADTVIRMDTYLPQDVTAKARTIAAQHPTGRQVESTAAWPALTPRIPLAKSLNPRKGKREVSIKGRALRAVLFGLEEIDMSAVAQLVDEGQVRAIGQALNLARERFMDNRREVAAVVEAVIREIEQEGLDALDPRQTGDYVAFRVYELAAALNRLRTLRVKSGTTGL
ncbi:MAG: ABC-ATPase domain-containing protein [Anaerolineae bacterium]|nr:ABC-ATPase domain-containing protein [Anaerolineae bacterium]